MASQQMGLVRSREEAAMKIQRAFRAKKQQKYQKMLLMKSSYVLLTPIVLSLRIITETPQGAPEIEIIKAVS